MGGVGRGDACFWPGCCCGPWEQQMGMSPLRASPPCIWWPLWRGRSWQSDRSIRCQGLRKSSSSSDELGSPRSPFLPPNWDLERRRGGALKTHSRIRATLVTSLGTLGSSYLLAGASVEVASPRSPCGSVLHVCLLLSAWHIRSELVAAVSTQCGSPEGGAYTCACLASQLMAQLVVGAF